MPGPASIAAVALAALAGHGVLAQTCVRNPDCTLNAWCKDPAYDTWCPQQGSSCPSPMCMLGSQQATSSLQATTTSTAASSQPATTPKPASSTTPKLATTSVKPTTTARRATTTARRATTTPRVSTATTTTTRAPSSSFLAPSTTASSAPGSCAGRTTGLGSWFTPAMFASFFPNINNAACTGAGFFTWCALVQAADAFPDFANSGDMVKDMTELAAFLAQTSHETTGGWATAPGGPQAWGYCFKEEVGCGSGSCTGYCAAGNPCAGLGYDCTCAAGQTYHGRGPIQLSWNYNYAGFSKDVLGDPSILVKDPSQLTRDAVLSFKSGLWFWMSAQAPKPSCHAVITGAWTPSSSDLAAGRVAGFGMVTNIINGGLECNMPTDARVTDRVEFFKRYLTLLGVAIPSDSTLYCNKMASY